MSWMFYEAQRSGPVQPGNRISWRGASHTGDPVLGGWHDAGDHLKLNLPMASSAVYLAWGVLEFKDAYVKVTRCSTCCFHFKWSVHTRAMCCIFILLTHPPLSKKTASIQLHQVTK
jgi:endoglucanase